MGGANGGRGLNTANSVDKTLSTNTKVMFYYLYHFKGYLKKFQKILVKHKASCVK